VSHAGHGHAEECDPHEHAEHVETLIARSGRALDTPVYTAAQIRAVRRDLRQTLREKRSAPRSQARGGLVFRIPVHVNVLSGAHQGETGPRKPAVLRQLEILNAGFFGSQSRANRKTPFRFYLRSFKRVKNDAWYHASMDDRANTRMRRALHRGGPQALNLYISAPEATGQGAVLGFSSVPWQADRFRKLDGVTIHRGTMEGGDRAGYNLGDTAIHEVGHWMGLFHTFEGGCSQPGDLINDTPAEREPSFACELGRDTCPGRKGRDPVRNFMDYSFDSCMNQFTPDQVARMGRNWFAYRAP